MAEDSLVARAKNTIIELDLIQKLIPFNPHWVGSIPINIGIENSDIDIACKVSNPEKFKKICNSHFENMDNFSITEKSIREIPTIICRFNYAGFLIEIFGQNVEVKDQFAFKHMIIEQKILVQNDDKYRDEIIQLKKEGYSTEEAFALKLGIKGDPYIGLLKFE